MSTFKSGAGVDIEDNVPPGLRGVSDPFIEKSEASKTSRIKLLPSQWVENFIKVKDGDTGKAIPMDFSERRYLLRPYNTPRRKKLLLTSRQTEKSSSISCMIMAGCGMRAGYVPLFVSPSAMQTKVFSNTRIDDIIEISPMLKAMTHRRLVMNILEKEFINKSKIYLRYAFLSADRIRGLSANAIYLDEVQDLLQELIPVIEETASHHKDPVFVYSGTPKTFDNTIEVYWSRHSTMSEWVIPCERHGTPKNPSSWFWNVLGYKNIGKTGPICEKCGHFINPEHPAAQWVEMNPGAEIEGFRVCRLMVPWFFKDATKWQEILHAQERYPTAQFMNEVLATSHDSGDKPLTTTELIRACDPDYENSEERTAELGKTHVLYAGIDWGGGGHGGNSYTLLTVGGYVRGDEKLQILFMKRFSGPLAEPDAQMAEIRRLLVRFRVKLIGTDFGGGFFPNKVLTNKFGAKRVHPFQYVHRAPAKLLYKPAIHRYMVFRSLVMSDIFQAIKKVKIRFFNWEQFREPFATDMLAIRAEYNEQLHMTQYIKISGIPDDSFHSVLYLMLVSMLEIRRPDIMAPIQDGTDQDAQLSMAEEQLREEMELFATPNVWEDEDRRF